MDDETRRLVTRDAEVREVRDDEGTKGLEATFHVAVAPDALLDVLWDVNNFGRLFPDIEEAKLLRAGGDAAEIAYCVATALRRVRYVLRRTRDRATGTIAWRELSGDLRKVRGHWRVAPTADPGVTRVTYAAYVDVGWFVPTAVVRDFAIHKLGEMVERVRRVAAEIHAGRGRS